MNPTRKLCWNYGRSGLKTGKSGFDISGLKKLQKELERLKEKAEPFAEECTKELGARVLSKVIKRTPVGNYQKENELMRYKRGNAKKGIKAGDVMLTKSGKERREKYKPISFKTSKGKAVTFRADTSGKKGGTLRRGWTSHTNSEAESGGKGNAKEYAASLPVKKEGNKLTLDIVNPVEYASYVEYGHRKRGGKGWVPGHFMLEKSRQEVEKIAPKVIEKKLNKFLGGGFK